MLRGKILFLLALVAAPTAAAAQVLPAPMPDKLLSEGHKLYLAGDAGGALAKYVEAKDADTGKAAAYYFVAMAKARLGNTDEAIAALDTAATIAGDKDVAMHAKALFAAAVIREHKGEWDAAFDAWNRYVGYAQSHADAAGFADAAKARITVIERRRALETEGAAIRSRAENKGN